MFRKIGLSTTFAMSVRSFFWRFGRYFYLRARGDLPFSPKKNGEYFLIQSVLSLSHSLKIIVYDVGANKGEWTDNIDQMTKLTGVKMSAHLFEPANDAYLFLKRKYQNLNHILINHAAVLERSGEASLGVVGELAGTNSFFNLSSKNIIRSEMVKVMTLTEYNSFKPDENIDFIKIDAEGSDFLVIKGAEKLFIDGKVQICQFEYNHRWIYSRRFLKDVFDLPSLEQYSIAKLHTGWIEIFSEWQPELEKYFECNYLIIKKDHPILAAIGVNVDFGRCNTPHNI